MNTETDPRRGLPSASATERFMFCPGSWNAQKGLPQVETEDSRSGDLTHRAAAGDKEALAALDDHQLKTLEMCESICKSIVAAHFDAVEPEVKTEERLWLYGDATGYEDATERTPIFSGQFDRLYFSGYTGVLIDFKTLFGDTPEAPDNWQLLSLAVLASKAYDLNRVIVAKVQPWVSPQFSLCEYDSAALEAAEIKLRAGLERANNPQAKRIPGAKQCKFCRAKLNCPEFSAESMKLETVGPTPLATAAQLVAWWDRWQLCKIAGKAIEEELRLRLSEDNESVPGMRLKPGRVNKSIDDPTTVFTRAVELGVTQRSFLGCVTVGKADLKMALKDATGKKGKLLDAAFDSVVDGCLGEQQCAPSLERIKS